LAAAISALPVLTATVRKLWLVANVAGEVASARAPSAASSVAVAVVVRLTVAIATHVSLLLLVLFLSSTIAPPAHVFGGLLAAVALLAVVFRHRLAHRYQEIQGYFGAPAPLPPDETGGISQMLSGVRFTRVTVGPGSAHAGVALKDLRLRAATGATVVAIERPGNLIVNPDPATVVEAGDRLLLLGDEAQVATARALLAGA
jgi:uncharacterized transporter YbjL